MGLKLLNIIILKLMLEKSDHSITTLKYIKIAYPAAHRMTLLALVFVHETSIRMLKGAHVNQAVHLVVRVTIIVQMRLLQQQVQQYSQLQQQQQWQALLQ